MSVAARDGSKGMSTVAGTLKLNRNSENYLAEVEQAASTSANTQPGSLSA